MSAELDIRDFDAGEQPLVHRLAIRDLAEDRGFGEGLLEFFRTPIIQDFRPEPLGLFQVSQRRLGLIDDVGGDLVTNLFCHPGLECIRQGCGHRCEGSTQLQGIRLVRLCLLLGLFLEFELLLSHLFLLLCSLGCYLLRSRLRTRR